MDSWELAIARLESLALEAGDSPHGLAKLRDETLRMARVLRGEGDELLPEVDYRFSPSCPI